MKTATLIRDEIRSEVIRGTLRIAGKTFHILERPWQDNRCDTSCIPSGEYRAVFLPQSDSGKHTHVYHLQAVPGRSGIFIHSGNVVDDTRGCLIIGLARGDQDGKPAVLDSRAALADLVRVTEGENFVLTILEHKD